MDRRYGYRGGRSEHALSTPSVYFHVTQSWMLLVHLVAERIAAVLMTLHVVAVYATSCYPMCMVNWYTNNRSSTLWHLEAIHHDGRGGRVCKISRFAGSRRYTKWIPKPIFIARYTREDR